MQTPNCLEIRLNTPADAKAYAEHKDIVQTALQQTGFTRVEFLIAVEHDREIQEVLGANPVTSKDGKTPISTIYTVIAPKSGSVLCWLPHQSAPAQPVEIKSADEPIPAPKRGRPPKTSPEA